MKDFLELKDVFDNKTSFLLVAHQDPDGDALGAILSMGRFLLDSGKTVRLASRDSAPKLFQFLNGSAELNHDFLIGDFDVIILLDNGDLKRTGFAERIVRAKKAGKTIINIDHHPQNDIWKVASLNIADPESSSTCEIIYDIFKSFGYLISVDTATNLLAGIYYDTGGFIHPNTSDKVLHYAGELLKAGASLRKVSRSVKQSRSLGMLKLWGMALNRIKVLQDYGLAYTIITQKDIEDADADEEDISGLVNMVNTTAEARASLLLFASRDGKIKGSLRTDSDKIDVSRMAKYFGGGGHKKASGFTISGTIKKDGNGWKVE